jgi:hypothetical protein
LLEIGFHHHILDEEVKPSVTHHPAEPHEGAAAVGAYAEERIDESLLYDIAMRSGPAQCRAQGLVFLHPRHLLLQKDSCVCFG